MNGISTRIKLIACCAALFAGVIAVHTRHNHFAWYYHPDEPGKVEQVLGMRPLNFHHPMLLLRSTQVVAAVSGSKTPQAVVENGRWVSAIFTAGAIVALALLAYAWRGWLAAVTTGLTLTLHHQLFELSHYMKEDTALLLGIAVTFFAAHRLSKLKTLGAALLVGFGCGLAISGKLPGVLALLIALPPLLDRRMPERGLKITAIVVTLVAVVLIVNWPMVTHPAEAWASFQREKELVTGGQGGVTQSVPHTRYWSIFLSNTTPVVWILLLAVLWAVFRHRREFGAMERVIVAFPFAFAVLLSFSPKENDRYFLPASAIFILISVVGAGELRRFFRTTRPRLIEGIACAALVLSMLPDWTKDRGGLLRYEEAFQHDDTAELVEWLRAKVPATAVIAHDEKVRLPTEARHGNAGVLPHKIISEDYVADLGTFSELQAKGVTHVVTTPSTYQRFDRGGLKPKPEEAASFERRKLFYAELRREFEEPIWERRRSTVIYLHPGLEVYSIAAQPE